MAIAFLFFVLFFIVTVSSLANGHQTLQAHPCEERVASSYNLKSSDCIPNALECSNRVLNDSHFLGSNKN